jgi:hypothetical protein
MRLAGPVGPIALDGTHAAYTILNDSDPTCHFGARVYSLDLSTGRSIPASGHATCSWEQSSTGRGVFELAAAGKRVTWLVNFGGNTESGEILFSSAGRPGKDTTLARSDRIGPDLDTLTGTEIGGLVSDGTRISYSTWTVENGTTVTKGSLRRLPVRTQLAPDAAAVVDASADGGRVAVLRGDGTVAIFGVAGQLLQTITPPPARAVALDGDLLAVLTKTGTVAIYDRLCGCLLHTWPIAAGAMAVDASGGIAVYSTLYASPGAVHALDLATGADVTLFSAHAVVAGARISTAGVLYGYNTRAAGKLVFVPFASLAKSLSAT